MKLQEFLQVISNDDYIGIWNIEDGYKTSKARWGGRPTEQQYFKVGNIPYGRIKNFLQKDVLGVNHTPKGYLVRISDFERIGKKLDRMYLADEIADRMETKGRLK